MDDPTNVMWNFVPFSKILKHFMHRSLLHHPVMHRDINYLSAILCLCNDSRDKLGASPSKKVVISRLSVFELKLNMVDNVLYEKFEGFFLYENDKQRQTGVFILSDLRLDLSVILFSPFKIILYEANSSVALPDHNKGQC